MQIVSDLVNGRQEVLLMKNGSSVASMLKQNRRFSFISFSMFNIFSSQHFRSEINYFYYKIAKNHTNEG